VTTLQDSGTGSLRWAIENAPAGSTITFDTGLQGTLRLTSDSLHISKRLSIRGPGAERLTINGGPNDEFGVGVSPTGSVTIADLAFNVSSIYSAGALTLINSIVSGDSASGSGGGIYNDKGSTLTLSNSTVTGNRADTGGGLSNDGKLTLINSTISGNRAQGPGGGILNSGLNSRTEMIFCTMYGNTSGEGGGGISNGVTNSASQLVMKNSFVAGNKAPSGPDILGMLTSQGYNLIQNTQDTTFASSPSHGTDLLQVAPTALRIDPLLKKNNGSTQTHALLPGSAAIDRIPLNDCRIKDISTDQRGVRRPQGEACDIGAYELLE
jgi:hypothetical protein